MSNDKIQELILSRTRLALMGALVHTAVCYNLYTQGYFRTTLLEFIFLFGFLWSVNVLIYILIRLKLNWRFKDPGVTLPLMIWSLIWLLGTIYLTNHLRTVLLMITLLIMMFGIFRLYWYEFLYLTLGVVIAYTGIIIALFKFHPEVVNIQQELLIVLVFAFVLFFSSNLARDLSDIRLNLKSRTFELEKALKKIELTSVTDELTHVKNRRYILDVLNHQRLMADRERTHIFSVCMIDIDHFKKVNDDYGHGVGDIVLKALCKEVELSLRKIDVFGRLGGEEFIIIAPFTDHSQAKILSERVRESVEKMTLYHNNILLKITVSVGASQFQWPESTEDLLARVDSALYEAKNKGRNQVVMR